MEEQAEYVTEAMELLRGTSVEIQPARTALVRENGEFREVEKPAFIKLSTAFKSELPNVSGDALKVWIFICLSINRKSERANPGLRTIAAGSGMGVNTVQSALRELEALNLLKVDRQSRKYNIYEAPEYVSANRQEPVSGLDTDGETVSEKPESVSENGQSVSGIREDFLLNQRNQTQPDWGEVSKQANRKVDAILDLERQSAGKTSYPKRESLPEAIRELIDAFVEATNIKPLGKETMGWLMVGQDWLNLGASPSDIRGALEYAKGKFAIMTPHSLTNTLRAYKAGQLKSEKKSEVNYL